MRGRHKKAQAGSDDWLILSDLSMGGFIIFLIIALVYMTRYSTAKAAPKDADFKDPFEAQQIIDSLRQANRDISDTLQIYKAAQHGIYDVLKEFEDMPMIDIQKDGTVRFKVENGKELFRPGKAERTLEFHQAIVDFLPLYFEKIRPYYESGQIVEIRIEGHTDINCANVNQRERDCYKYNLDLSQSRARNVLDFMLQHRGYNSMPNKHILRGKMLSVGHSYSKTLDIEGHPTAKSGLPPNDITSRRVDLKTIIRPN